MGKRRWVDVEVSLYNSDLLIKDVGAKAEKTYVISRDSEITVKEDHDQSLPNAAEYFVFSVEGGGISKTLATTDENVRAEWIDALTIASKVAAIGAFGLEFR